MNFETVGAIIIILIAIGSLTWTFLNASKEQKIANIKEWLKWAVTMAEKDLGSGTGQLKLRHVYDMAIKEFPWLIKLVAFSQFSLWVDEALEWMRQQLVDNKSVNNFVYYK